MAKRKEEEMTEKRAFEILHAFVERTTAVRDHSLFRDGRIDDYSQPQLRITLFSGHQIEIRANVPSDQREGESFESLAARVRPFTVTSESIYLMNVFDAIDFLSHFDNEKYRRINLEAYRRDFNDRYVDENLIDWEAIVPDRENEDVRISDSQVAKGWMYGDLVHRDLHPSRPPVRDLSLPFRRLAAFSYYSSLAIMVVNLLSEIEASWGEKTIGLL